jgi:aminoglycoside phosphotransferase (APT) family kinase protein
MTGTIGPPGISSRQLDHLLNSPDHRVVVLALSKDPDGKLTVLLLPRRAGRALVVKVPLTDGGQAEVDHEAQFLDELARRRLATTLSSPRLDETVAAGGRLASVMTLMPGTPMSIQYHAWRHTARPKAVAGDFAKVQRWLDQVHAAPTGPREPVTWFADLLPRLEQRWPEAGEGGFRRKLEAAARRLESQQTPRTVVHGDLWFGNLLVMGPTLTGVVDWECGTVNGEPLRDIARFSLSYALYLDRHTRSGRRVAGHEGLRANTWGAGVAYALSGNGWFPDLFRGFLCRNLSQLGASPEAWFDVGMAGLAEVAAVANHPGFAEAHLRLLRDLIGRYEQ